MKNTSKADGGLMLALALIMAATGMVILVTPIADEVSRRGFPMWLLALLLLAFAGWFGFLAVRAIRRSG